MDEKPPSAAPPAPVEEAGDAEWFREPTRREQWLGAGLFAGFGVFFLLFFYVQRGSNFRWIILGLGVISILRATRHMIKAIRAKA